MITDRSQIKEIIKLRENMNDPVKSFSIRNKDSPPDKWQHFKEYNEKEFNLILFTNVDGFKINFKHVTLDINGRY